MRCTGLVSAPRCCRTPWSIQCRTSCSGLGSLSDVSLDHTPLDYAALVPCGVGPTLVTVSLAYHAIADGDGELPVRAHGRGPARPKRLVAHHSVPSLLELSVSVVSESDGRHVVRRALPRLGGAPTSEI